MKIGSTFNHEIYGPLKITGKRYSRMGNKSLWIGTDEQGEDYELDGSERPAKPEKASPKFLKEAAEMFGMTQGPQGDKGMDADEEAIIQAVIPQVLERIELPENGKDGADADTELIVRELLPLVMEKMPKPEKINEASIVSKVLSRIRIPQDGKPGEKGKDGSPDTAVQVKEKLETLKGDERLDASAIKNLPKQVTQIGGGHSYTGLAKVDATGTPGTLQEKIVAGTNVTITKINDTLRIASSGGGGGGGQVDSIVAGNNIDVDATDPANPIVSVETLTLADISDVTASATEVNYTDGVTSNIQTQLNAKQGAITSADTQVLFSDGANTPAGDAGLTYNKTTNSLSTTGKLTVNIPDSANANALDITQGDTTNNPIAAIISNNGTKQALKIIQNGNTSSSTSTGGSVLLDNTANTGAGLIIYSNQATPSGRLVNIRANSSTFDEAALHVDYNGTRNAVEIVANSVTDDAVPLTITNTNWTASTIGVSSDVENHGSYKSIHSFPSAGVGASGSDAVASHISLDSQGVGTAVQGIFMTSTTAGGGTSGKLLNLRNRVQAIGDVETELMTLTGDGLMGLSSATPGAVLDVAYANKTGVTAESILFRSKSQTLTLTDGTTITNFRQNQFLAPTINGVVGGGTETITTGATVYIDNAPSGSNITFTNGPYALLVNAGDSKFGGQVIATTFRTSSGGIVNNSSSNNARLQLNSTGNIIDRNIADANPALIVQQVHASSTGDILQVKNNASTVLTVSQAGALSIGTSNALTTGTIELGAASDTTLSRSAAGVLAVEGVVIPSISSTNTLTNKRITPRTGTTTSSATPTINTDNVDFYSLTAQTVDITSFTTNLSGTPTEGQKLWIAITGTAARAITWGASFEASTVALPTTTVTTNRLDVGFVWNTVTSKWRCMASA